MRTKDWLGATLFLLSLLPLAAGAATCTARTFTPSEDQVLRAYLAYYGRLADTGGLGYWAGRLDAAGGDLAVIIQPFGASQEFNDRFGHLDDEALVVNLYRQLFGRDPDPAGLAYYRDALASGRMTLQTAALEILYGASGTDVLVLGNRIAASRYFVSCAQEQGVPYPDIPAAVALLAGIDATQQSLDQALATIDVLVADSGGGYRAQVTRAYLAYYGRPPDLGGLTYWAAELGKAGGDLAVIIGPFGVSDEFDDRFGSLSSTGLVGTLYRQLFGRDPDAGGLAFYSAELAAGHMTPQSVALAIINAASGDDAQVVASRIEVSEYLASKMADGLLGYPPIPVAVSLVSDVDATQERLDAALARIDSLVNDPGNQAPYAGRLSFVADPAIVYAEAQLVGFDPDGDLISYNFLSPGTGPGYLDAHIGGTSGRLYLTLDGSGQTVHLEYNVSDGLVFSPSATVEVRIAAVSDDNGTGAEDTDAVTYAGFDILRPWGELLGAPGADPAIPRSIDLSASFPVPGNQGSQGSCVGWATAYAIKSYFEKRDLGWDLSRTEHVFSPAYVFNPIALAGCNGSYPSDALNRLQSIGAATWDQMPYTDQDCTRAPAAAADAQAASFRIRSWGTLRTVDDVKAQLANHRPALLAIAVYPSFYNLTGPDALYNDYSGTDQGGHAVAIVGFNDDRYGGAFKVINSWGTDWGDGGFFWIPYAAFSNPNVVRQVYGIEDIANDDPPVDPVDPPPPPSGDLPNLEIIDWSADYDPRPGGYGELRFIIGNTGTAVAPAGAYVNLMLSPDTRIAGDDVFVVYEPIPFHLLPGETAYRDEFNALGFFFPDTLPAGTYLMAVWVDDLDSVRESDEGDNVSLGTGQVRIDNSLPDLVVTSWYADWFGYEGYLTYEVMNQGLSTAPRGWDVNLMLSGNDILGDGDDIYLAYETTAFDLAPGETVYRDWFNPLYFGTYGVPTGSYWMAVWVDDLDDVAESNERNNVSWGWAPVWLGAELLGATDAHTPAARPHRQFNGRRLPVDAQLFRVEILAGAHGSPGVKVLEQVGPRRGTAERLATRQTRAANPHAFPVARSTPMPGGG